MANRLQTGALTTGMSLSFDIAGRLKAYFEFFQRIQHLPPSSPIRNFESILVKMYAHLLAFFAKAIRAYGMSTSRRTLEAIWYPSDLEGFASRCSDLAASAEIEASGCDRYLSRIIRQSDIEQWKQSRDTAVQSLNLIKNIEVDMTFVRLNVELSKLEIATNAIHSTYKANPLGCLEGTQTKLIHQIQQWADDIQAKPIFWLCGKAGTGKSTLSVTIAKHFKEQQRLGGSFLFKRGESNRTNANLFFTTIAKQLMEVIPTISTAIATALRADFNLPNDQPQIQFRKLLLEPLLTLSQDQFPTRLVFVVDALDECTEKQHIREILSFLKELATSTPMCARIFITSRPEADFAFRAMDSSKSVYRDVHLEVVQHDTIKSDLMIFFKDCFAGIKADRLNRRVPRPLPTNWPTVEDLESLVELANPLFIYAATLTRYLKSRNSTPQNRLEVLLRNRESVQLGDPGQIYLPILDQMASEHDEGDDMAIKRFKQIVGPIVLLADPLSVNALAILLDIDVDCVIETLGPLYSVLDLPSELNADRNVAIHPFHLSFGEFLIDNTFLTDSAIRYNRFWIDKAKTHGELAQKCLLRLSNNSSLHYDICSTSEPGTLRASIAAQDVENSLPTDIAYACCHWVFHLCKSNPTDAHAHQVFDFLKEHFLHWVEAMSWLGRVSGVIADLNRLKSFLPDNAGSQLMIFLRDAQRFMLRNRPVIDVAPLQLYFSALIFSPQESLVRIMFQDEHNDKWLPVLPSIPRCWTSEIQILEGHKDAVSAVCFSPDGRHLVSASWDNTLHLWDATTGEKLREFHGHTEPVPAVSFSPDGCVIVSASWDETIKLWDVATGKELRQFEGHSDGVESIIFSPIGDVLASASSDHTVRLWNLTEITDICTFEGHTDVVRDVKFSLDGQLLISASFDKTVKIWDVKTRKQIRSLNVDIEQMKSVALSSQGDILALASTDGIVHLCDTISGQELLTLSGHRSGVRCVAFSPIVDIVASASYDGTVRLWNSTSGEEIQKFASHDNGVLAVAFSPNGRTLASASLDKTIRLWNITAHHDTQKLIGFTAMVKALHLTSDADLLISTSVNGVAQLWSPRDGKKIRDLPGRSAHVDSIGFRLGGQVLQFTREDRTSWVEDTMTGEILLVFGGSESKIKNLAFSADDRVIAIALKDGGVHLWDAMTGRMLSDLAINEPVAELNFSDDGRHLETNVGVFDVMVPSPVPSLGATADPPQLALSDQWIQYQGRNVLWLPHEYRGSTSATKGDILVIGQYSGDVSFFGAASQGGAVVGDAE